MITRDKNIRTKDATNKLAIITNADEDKCVHFSCFEDNKGCCPMRFSGPACLSAPNPVGMDCAQGYKLISANGM